MSKTAAPGDDPHGPDEEAEAVRLSDAWEQFLVAVRRARARSGEREDQLSLSQYEFVRPLMSGAGLPVSRLAERFGITPATATQLLDGLERGGAIVRERSSEDRRKVTITLTDEGRRRVEQKRRSLAAQRRRFLANLTPEEQATTERTLRRLAELIGEL